MGLMQKLGGLRVVVFVGSGGVGKTTAAAAFALRAAIDGKRVLCLTVDPAKRLADSLGITMGEEQEQRVPDELFERHGLRCAGSLTAVMLDRKRTFDNLVVKYAGTAEQRERILNNKLYQYVSTALAGTQEYTALEKLLLSYQETFGRDGSLDPGNVIVEYPDDIVFVVHTAVELPLPDDLVHPLPPQTLVFILGVQRLSRRGVNGVVDAVIPAFRIPSRENHL